MPRKKQMSSEILKLALEALEDLGMKHFESTGEVLYKETCTAIKEALAQSNHIGFVDSKLNPIQRTWVGLTDEEVITMSRYDLEYAALIGEVERKLKEKNT